MQQGSSLSNVNIDAPTDGQVLTYDASSSTWSNETMQDQTEAATPTTLGTVYGLSRSEDEPTILGYSAGGSLASGMDGSNVIVGHHAGSGLSLLSSDNTFLGEFAGYGGVERTSTSNTYLGRGAGFLATGNNNTAVGEGAGQTTNGSFNTLIGEGTRTASGASHAIVLGCDTTDGESNTFTVDPIVSKIRMQGMDAYTMPDDYYNFPLIALDRVIYKSEYDGEELAGELRRAATGLFQMGSNESKAYPSGYVSLEIPVSPEPPTFLNFSSGITVSYPIANQPRATINTAGIWEFSIFGSIFQTTPEVNILVTDGDGTFTFAIATRTASASTVSRQFSGCGALFLPSGTQLQFLSHSTHLYDLVEWRIVGRRVYP